MKIMSIIRGINLVKVSKLLGVLLVFTLALFLATAVSAGEEKVEVCHVTNIPAEGDGIVITIADPSWEAHAAHGDKKLDELGVILKSSTECLVGPIAVDDFVTTLETFPVVINVLLNDLYFEPVDVSVLVIPEHGVLTTPVGGGIEYTPFVGFDGTDSFIYQLCDPSGCDTATVYITVEDLAVP
jgi:hypothetical protein